MYKTEKFLAQAIIVAKHWKDQEGINAKEMDALADRMREIDPARSEAFADPERFLSMSDKLDELHAENEQVTAERNKAVESRDFLDRRNTKLERKLSLAVVRAAGDATEIMRLRGVLKADGIDAKSEAFDTGLDPNDELIVTQATLHRTTDQLRELRVELRKLQREPRPDFHPKEERDRPQVDIIECDGRRCHRACDEEDRRECADKHLAGIRAAADELATIAETAADARHADHIDVDRIAELRKITHGAAAETRWIDIERINSLRAWAMARISAIKVEIAAIPYTSDGEAADVYRIQYRELGKERVTLEEVIVRIDQVIAR